MDPQRDLNSRVGEDGNRVADHVRDLQVRCRDELVRVRPLALVDAVVAVDRIERDEDAEESERGAHDADDVDDLEVARARCPVHHFRIFATVDIILQEFIEQTKLRLVLDEEDRDVQLVRIADGDRARARLLAVPRLRPPVVEDRNEKHRGSEELQHSLHDKVVLEQLLVLLAPHLEDVAVLDLDHDSLL